MSKSELKNLTQTLFKEIDDCPYLPEAYTVFHPHNKLDLKIQVLQMIYAKETKPKTEKGS